MILREPEIYYAAVCLVMVCSSLFCALVRYFHLCRPFDEHEEYFYPAPMHVSLCPQYGFSAWTVPTRGFSYRSFSFCSFPVPPSFPFAVSSFLK